MACVLALSACGARGVSIGMVEADPTIITGSVAASPPPVDEAVQSDAMTLRNVVTSVDVDEIEVEPLAWVNVETGSRGLVRSIEQHEEGGLVCRSFEATRESYDGVAVYTGESCLAPGGMWAMTAFDRL